MAKKRKIKKELAEVATQTSSSGSNLNPNNDSTTLDFENQVFYSDNSESQLYDANGNYKQPVQDDVRARHWIFIVYEESAPIGWEMVLADTGIPFIISEWHEFDKNPDGSDKKKHLHGIISYANTTTYRNVKVLIRTITNGPYPLKCESVSGAYAYFTHKWNPEKYQYPGTGIRRFNGWEKVLESSDIANIKKELTIMCFSDDIQEYSELIIETLSMDGDYQTVAMNNTVYFDRLISSYRHAPVRTLTRYLKQVQTDEERKEIEQRLGYFIGIEEEHQYGNYEN